jgi:Na+/proline symporter
VATPNLIPINDNSRATAQDVGLGYREEIAMSRNMGTIDQFVRIVIGLALIAFAFQDGLSIQGWHWLGLIGIVPILTAFFGFCPAYTILGISTRRRIHT